MYLSNKKGFNMKSRELKTIFDLIVSNYTISPVGSGKFEHSFTPSTTTTVYKFIANGTPELIEGERYNIGYVENVTGEKIVDPSCLSKNSEVDKNISFQYASLLSKEKHNSNKLKNDQRVNYTVQDGYYWGKKYAWREFGLFISKDVFYKYLEEINHPKTECLTINPDMPYGVNEASIAYREDGLMEAMKELVDSAERVSKVYFKSPLYSRKFAIRGIQAITDKK